jgi:serine/threonine protein kinase
MTQGYCAPEVWYADARDNSSDVWSLGRVFCDMLTVLAGKPMTELSERIGGNLRRIYDEDCLEDLHKWLSGFSLENIRHDTLATNIQQLIKKMVSDHSSSQYCVCSQRSDVQGSKLAT